MRVVLVVLQALGVTAAVLLGLALLLVAVTMCTPRLFVWVMHITHVFDRRVLPPLQLKQVSADVRVQTDVAYPSRYGSNTFDLYAPAAGGGPVLFWVHGGGFIGGDKTTIRPIALRLAAKGYTVVSLNYALAPKTHYPAALVQLGEVYEYLRANAPRFGAPNLCRLAFGGDSAGAQIALQFVLLQTNPALAEAMHWHPQVPKESIKANVLYCGPYDLAAFAGTGSKVLGFFVQQLGWAYFGHRGWMRAPKARQASVLDHVTAACPPTFLTDGNAFSFEEQGRALCAKLTELGVSVQGLFYGPEAGELHHDYQFSFDQYPQQAEECYQDTLDFLNRYL